MCVDDRPAPATSRRTGTTAAPGATPVPHTPSSAATTVDATIVPCVSVGVGSAVAAGSTALSACAPSTRARSGCVQSAPQSGVTTTAPAPTLTFHAARAFSTASVQSGAAASRAANGTGMSGRVPSVRASGASASVTYATAGCAGRSACISARKWPGTADARTTAPPTAAAIAAAAAASGARITACARASIGRPGSVGSSSAAAAASRRSRTRHICRPAGRAGIVYARLRSVAPREVAGSSPGSTHRGIHGPPTTPLSGCA